MDGWMDGCPGPAGAGGGGWWWWTSQADPTGVLGRTAQGMPTATWASRAETVQRAGRQGRALQGSRRNGRRRPGSKGWPLAESERSGTVQYLGGWVRYLAPRTGCFVPRYPSRLVHRQPALPPTSQRTASLGLRIPSACPPALRKCQGPKTKTPPPPPRAGLLSAPPVTLFIRR